MKTNSYFILFIWGHKEFHLKLIAENCSQCFVTKHTIPAGGDNKNIFKKTQKTWGSFLVHLILL